MAFLVLHRESRLLYYFLFTIVMGLLCSISAAQAGNKPMGAWFEGYEKFLLDDEFIWETAAFIDTRFVPVDLDRLPLYSAILLGRGAGRTLTAEENKTLEQWVAAGGTLIFTSDEPRRLWDNKPPEWVGGAGAGAWWSSTPIVATIQHPRHPLLKGIAELSPKEGWKEESGFGNFTAGQSLVGADAMSTLYENKHGKGRVIYASEQFIPTKWPASAEGKITLNLSPLMRQFWINLVAYLELPTRHEVIAEWAKSRATGEPIAVWFSHDDKPLGGRTHNPPHPSKPGDEFKEIRFDMGIGEFGRRDFFVTTLRDIPELVVEATDLKSAAGAVIPAASIRLDIQDKPMPDYPKASYWLTDPKNVDPIGSPGVKMRADETYTYWILLQSGESTSPGDYTGELRLRAGGTVLHSIPLHVKVWPLHQPGGEVMHFEMEHVWYSMPGGYWPDPKEYNPILLKKYIDHLGELRVDVGETWGDIDKGYYNKFITRRADGRPLDEALSQSPESFLKDPMPSLSFAGGPWDQAWTDAIQAGMNSFSQSWAIEYDPSLDFARRAMKNDKLAVGSPEHLRFLRWYRGEHNKYLRERGLLDTYVKIGDESGPEGIPNYIRSAEPIRAAGFKAYTTTYNLIQDKGDVERMDPYTDMWQIAWPLENPKVIFKQNDIPFDEHNEIWGTCASSYWGSWYTAGRGFGMLAARLRMDGVHEHGYMRWHRNEILGTLATPDGPADSAGVAMWGQGITDGRYLAKLYRMIDRAKKTNRGADVAIQIEREIEEQVVGVPVADKPSPLIAIKLEDETLLAGVKTRNTSVPQNLSDATCNAAKVKVFEMMLRLRDAMGPLEPHVRYGSTRLASDGRATCRLVGGEAKVAGMLADRIEQFGGTRPTIVTQTGTRATDRPETLVLIGTLKDNATLTAFVQHELATEVTPFSPTGHAYLIKQLPATAERPAALLVVGGDPAAVETGVRNLCRLMIAENRW
jgi:hypothetical protein